MGCPSRSVSHSNIWSSKMPATMKSFVASALHHHLEELLKHAYIRRTERGQYQLHPRGWTTYVAACQIASCLEELTPERFKWDEG